MAYKIYKEETFKRISNQTKLEIRFWVQQTANPDDLTELQSKIDDILTDIDLLQGDLKAVFVSPGNIDIDKVADVFIQLPGVNAVEIYNGLYNVNQNSRRGIVYYKDWP